MFWGERFLGVGRYIGMELNSDEQKLVEQAKNDPQAFAVLYDRYIGRIYAYVYHQTQDEAVAKDVTSATFEKALRHLRQYRWEGVSFCAWLYKIAYNEYVQQYRKQHFLTPLREWWANGKGRVTETAVQSRQSRHDVHLALERLSEKDRQVLILRYFEGLSSAEVAQVLGCSPDNVYLWLHRALQRLKQQLERMGTTEEVFVEL